MMNDTERKRQETRDNFRAILQESPFYLQPWVKSLADHMARDVSKISGSFWASGHFEKAIYRHMEEIGNEG